ncbi:MAG: hypothetical protein EXR81_02400 [Gammaproteobacteria bacterium]|nr:hypothetical protein [Gammaproteobacteria bacterium]
MKKIIIFILLLTMGEAFADSNAIFIMYHRVGDARYPTTNVTVEQFTEEMQYLHDQHYNVLPMADIITKLKHNETLPDKTVGISFDDAFDTIYTTAWPILKKYHFPFTLFVATEPLDKNFKGMMTWAQVKALAEQGVTIGDHSVTHGHLATANVATLEKEIMSAKERIYQETGQQAVLFAYPFGEYSLNFPKLLAKLGFLAAFTQITGAVNAQSDFYLLPRIPLNQHYADLSRFKQLLQIRALRVSDLTPAEPVLQQNPPIISFKISDPTITAQGVNCYDASGAALQLDKTHVPYLTIHFKKALPSGRTRINCTAVDKKGNWYWLGLLYIA